MFSNMFRKNTCEASCFLCASCIRCILQIWDGNNDLHHRFLPWFDSKQCENFMIISHNLPVYWLIASDYCFSQVYLVLWSSRNLFKHLCNIFIYKIRKFQHSLWLAISLWLDFFPSWVLVEILLILLLVRELVS